MQYPFNFRSLLLAALLLLSGVAQAASGDEAQAKPSEHDFNVTSVNKDKTHPYFGQGDSMGFAVNGVQGKVLELVRGKTYTFNVDTGVMHDFYIAAKPVGWGKAAMTAGVQGNYTYKGVVTFTPNADTPDVVYYVCRNHKFMGGEIRIVNSAKAGK